MIFRETAIAQGKSGEDLRDKEGYFLMTEDWEAYKELKAKKAE